MSLLDESDPSSVGLLPAATSDLMTSTLDDDVFTENTSAAFDPGLSFDVFDAIDRYVTPTWYVLGIPGNILAYCVWTRRRMRLSSGCYLAALALDECLFLVMQVRQLIRTSTASVESISCSAVGFLQFFSKSNERVVI
jgi:hypothetical protein